MTVRRGLFYRKAPEKAILVLNNYAYYWPRQTKLIVPRVGIARGRVYRLDIYSGASLLKTLYMNRPLLYSSCFCRFIILMFFNFWSVVVVELYLEILT